MDIPITAFVLICLTWFAVGWIAGRERSHRKRAPQTQHVVPIGGVWLRDETGTGHLELLVSKDGRWCRVGPVYGGYSTREGITSHIWEPPSLRAARPETETRDHPHPFTFDQETRC